MNLLNKNIKIIIFFIFFNAVLIKAELNYNNKELRNPFHSNIQAGEKIKKEADGPEKNEKAMGEIKKAGEGKYDKNEKLILMEKEAVEELNKIEVAAIMGNKKGYLVLFKEDSMIYKKNDYINKVKMIKIDKVDADSVKLTAELENGKKLSLQVPLKIK